MTHANINRYNLYRKKILFLLYSMNIGGVEKAFLGMISQIPLELYEVHVGLIQEKGGFISYIPKEVNIHKISIYKKYWKFINNAPLRNIVFLLKQANFIETLIHCVLYIHYKLTSNRYWFFKYLLRNEPMMPEQFDMAIVFAGPSQMLDF